MTDPGSTKDRPQTPDDRMTREEKEAYEDQVEELEGPDPRQVPGDQKKRPNDPGISSS